MGRPARGRVGPQVPAASATTGWNWPAGATISRSTRPWTRTTIAPRSGNCWRRTTCRCSPSANHLVGQAVLDNIDARHKAILPPYVWGDGNPAGVNARAAEEMKNTARAAQKLGVERGQRLHRLEHLAPAVLLPAGLARDDRRRLRAAGRAVQPDPRRVRRVRREVRPGGAPHGDRLRPVHGRAGAGRAGVPRGVRLQLRPQPPDLAGRRSGRVHPGIPRPHLSRPHEGRRS